MLTNPRACPSTPEQVLPLQAPPQTGPTVCGERVVCMGAVWFLVLSLQELSQRATWPLSVGYTQPSHGPLPFPCQEPVSP